MDAIQATYILLGGDENQGLKDLRSELYEFWWQRCFPDDETSTRFDRLIWGSFEHACREIEKRYLYGPVAVLEDKLDELVDELIYEMKCCRRNEPPKDENGKYVYDGAIPPNATLIFEVDRKSVV